MSTREEVTASAEAVLASLTASRLFDMRGVVAVITGGGTGIGLMIGTTLVANGATVYMIGPDQAQLDKTAAMWNGSAGPGMGKLVGIEGDVRSKDEAKRLASEIAKREPYVTVLFNNAGIKGPNLRASPPSAVEQHSAEEFTNRLFNISEAEFDDVMRTNAISSYWMSVAFLPLLESWKKSESGRRYAPQIVMTSSMNGWSKDIATSSGNYAYNMSKSAIGQFTSSLARELLPLGIRVNGIAPGYFLTEMAAPGKVDAFGLTTLPEDFKPPFEVPTAQRPGYPRAGTNMDVGSLALFLVANWFVDGETVLIDGGTLLEHPSSY